MKNKRLLPLFLMISLLMTPFTGCGNSAPGKDNPSSAEAMQPADTATEKAENSTRPSIDLKLPGDSSSSLPTVIIDTVDLEGNAYTNDTISDAKVILMNYWEPWCGPCVGEMPDLESLYEEYKDQGFLILGVYSTFDMKADTQDLAEEMGISYPIIEMTAELARFSTEYVPSSFFIKGDGTLLSTQPIVGANSYDSWKQMIEEQLEVVE